MGKGDPKTKRGKIAKGTYGVRRPRKNQHLKALAKLKGVATDTTSPAAPAQKPAENKKGKKE